ncbi:hypothetical protein [Rubritalea marina]|uniref:hypothetical protein n=1 Tax=Rubritalea marina TaxID=361055 RepID=UPI00035CD72E|nr:hypothetical protein [Rubritalea marina]
MSLRGFHIVFISLVTLFFAAFAAWGFFFGMQQDAKFWQPVAWICVATAILAPIYGAYFISKAKSLYSNA